MNTPGGPFGPGEYTPTERHLDRRGRELHRARRYRRWAVVSLVLVVAFPAAGWVAHHHGHHGTGGVLTALTVVALLDAGLNTLAARRAIRQPGGGS